MVSLSSDSIGNKLNLCRITLQNTMRTPAILSAVSTFGYTQARMQEGLALLNQAADRVNAATKAAGDQQIASAFARQRGQVVAESFQDLAKVARAIFLREPAVLALLGLDKPMPRTEGDLLRAADTLFNTTAYTDDIRTRLAAHGYTDGKLSGERGNIAEWRLALENHQATQGAARQAKAEQRAALKALVDWVAAYSKIARVALKQQPQLLETIGLLSRNARTKAQRTAAVKAAATRLQNQQDNPLPQAA